MSGSGTLGLEQAILGHTLAFAPMVAPVQIWVALDLAPPAVSPSESAPGTEVSGGGYTRMPATFALVATPANIAANTTSIEFPYATSAWGTIGYFELWDSPIAGNRLYWGQLIDPSTELTTAVTVSAGDILRFSPGALGVQAATGSGGTSSVGAYLPLGGGQMQGALLLAHDPIAVTEAATKSYVDAHSGGAGGTGFLPLSGGALTGALTLVGDAAAALQPVTLQQVNSASVGGPFLPVTGGVVATGSTASRTLQDRFAAAWNLKDFGAKSDGTTDDSAAITAAITAICALPHGGKLILPAGRTVVASAIVASIPAGVALTIEGMGSQASELYFSNATDGLNFTLRNSGNAWGAVSLHSFTVTRGPASPTAANTGINIIGDPAVAKQCSPGMSFRDLVIQGSQPLTTQWTNGLVLNGVSGCSVDNVGILGANSGATDLGDVGLTISGPGNPHFTTSINVVNSLVQGFSVGVLVAQYVQGVFIANSTIIGQYDSARWTGGPSYLAEELAITNCTIGAGHRGVYTYQVNQVTVTGVTILHFPSGVAIGFAGIEIDNAFLNNIAGNNVVGVNSGTEIGIIFSSCGTGPSTCYGNTTTNITGAGIWHAGNTTNVTTVGNNIAGGSAGILQDTKGSTLFANTWQAAPLGTGFAAPVDFVGATGLSRWFVGNDGSTEGGSNTGNNFEIVRCTDAGGIISAALSINRSNGNVSFGTIPTSYANDAAAAIGGVVVGQMYRNGSALMMRVS